jgi:SAM-dependent methyltransferase
MPTKQEALNIPVPPLHLRQTVGVEDTAFFENPYGDLVFGNAVNPNKYQSVFDFGCGCGRIARQLMQQRMNVPQKYVGLDLFKPSIEWCTQNLTRLNSSFVFHHHNFYNPGLNPGGSRNALEIPNFGKFSLVNAHSVFTHIIEDHVRFYFDQVANLIADEGCIRTSWFLCNKNLFPMMQTFQNSLYINTDDPSNAVIYDQEFVKSLYDSCKLNIYRVDPPGIRGHQWLVYASRGIPSTKYVFPEDIAPIGLARPPIRLSDPEDAATVNNPRSTP